MMMLGVESKKRMKMWLLLSYYFSHYNYSPNANYQFCGQILVRFRKELTVCLKEKKGGYQLPFSPDLYIRTLTFLISITGCQCKQTEAFVGKKEISPHFGEIDD